MNAPKPLSLTARTLFAELQELALGIGAAESLARMPGSVVDKSVCGHRYLYYQYRDVAGRTRQLYLGRDDPDTRAWLERLQQRERDRAEDLARLEELRKAFLAAGGGAMEPAPFRVLKAFADAGLTRPGPGHAVLIGTHAFNALANPLGVRWRTHMQTQDIDLAADPDLDIALPRPEAAAPATLERLGMGFIPVPPLDPRSPSTSFRVRGQELRVDLLAPMTGRDTEKSVMVPALGAPAQAVRFLDYLLEEAMPTVVVSRSQQVLVNLPKPERLALHKLLVSESRASAFANKAEKDRAQALQLLAVLLDEAPDGLREARAQMMERGPGWARRLERALARLKRQAPELVEALEGL